MIWSLILNLPSTAAVLPSAILFTKIPDNSAKGINTNKNKNLIIKKSGVQRAAEHLIK